MSRREPRGMRTPLSDRRLATKLLQRADLRDVRLFSCSASHNLAPPKPFKKINVAIQATAVVDKNEAAPRLLVRVRFDIVATPAEVESQSLKLNFEFQLKYHFEPPAPLGNADMVHGFTKWIGLNNAWPYAREFVQQMTSRMGLHPLKLPLYKPEEHEVRVIDEASESPSLSPPQSKRRRKKKRD